MITIVMIINVTKIYGDMITAWNNDEVVWFYNSSMDIQEVDYHLREWSFFFRVIDGIQNRVQNQHGGLVLLHKKQ